MSAQPCPDGATYDHERDHARLASQLHAVLDLMRDSRWRTPRELEQATGHSWASISARLRDLRKERFGANVVQREYRGRGLYAYRLLVMPRQMQLL